MPLSPEYSRILELMRGRGEKELARTREERLAPLYQRVGLRSPQVARQEAESAAELVGRLTDAEVDMLYRQVVRGEQLEDMEATRQAQIDAERRGVMSQSRLMGEQAGLREEQAVRDFGRQRQLIEEQREYEERLRAKSEKEQRKSMLANLLTSAGLGAATGGLGLIPGLAKGALGAIGGAVLGGPTASQMATYGLFSQPLQQPAPQIPLQFGTYQAGPYAQTPGLFDTQTSLYPDFMKPGRRSLWL